MSEKFCPSRMVALGVKPAYEDVDVGSFLAFLLTLVEDRIVPNLFGDELHGTCLDIGTPFA